ncbi:MAG: nuclear export factor, partial [Nocardioidaceae bacterium]|nr:nuclear export factor [Nocardioidaceae bacterium]
MHIHEESFARCCALVAVSGAIVAGSLAFGMSAASAHVSAAASVTSAGGYTLVTFSLPHGCDGSPTTSMTIQIPEGINSVTPTVVAGWSVDKVLEKLATPIDNGEDGQITERVKQVVYTADKPFPDGYRTPFDLSLQVPDVKAGTVLSFPTIQKCSVGETAWIQPQVKGEEEPEHPTPAFTVTASEGEGHGHSDAEEGDETETSEAVDDGGSSSAPGW